MSFYTYTWWAQLAPSLKLLKVHAKLLITKSAALAQNMVLNPFGGWALPGTAGGAPTDPLV